MLAASLNSRSTLKECSIKGPDFVKGSVSREVAQRARVLGLVEAHLAGAWHLETSEQPPALVRDVGNELDSPRLQARDRVLDVLAHEVELVMISRVALTKARMEGVRPRGHPSEHPAPAKTLSRVR